MHGDSFRLSHLCGGDSTSLGSDEQVTCKAIARAVPLAVVACGRGLQSWLVIVACRDLCGAIAVGHMSKEQKHEEKHEKKH